MDSGECFLVLLRVGGRGAANVAGADNDVGGYGRLENGVEGGQRVLG